MSQSLDHTVKKLLTKCQGATQSIKENNDKVCASIQNEGLQRTITWISGSVGVDLESRFWLDVNADFDSLKVDRLKDFDDGVVLAIVLHYNTTKLKDDLLHFRRAGCSTSPMSNALDMITNYVYSTFLESIRGPTWDLRQLKKDLQEAGLQESYENALKILNMKADQ